MSGARARWPWVLAGAVVVAAAVVGIVVAAGGSDDDAEDPFCEAFGALLVGPLADPATDATDPANLEVAVDVTDRLLDDLVGSAPTEAATASAEALAGQYREAFAVLAAYDYDLARVEAEATAEEQAVLDAFGSAPTDPGAADPFEDLEDVVADRCAPDVTFTTP
jgi:hypothetical protein